MRNDTRITFVVQYFIDKFLRKMFPAFAAEVSCFQLVRNRLRLISLRIPPIDLPDNVRFRFVDVIFFVFQIPAENILTARGVAFEPTFAQASVDLLL